ncbi:MAG TPA: hypothetical protein VHO28_02860 [Ignavibacteriales bacterium]|nr:hypothetical protein [Ignavibacteriales bacterium]HEX3074387.1 hypothetical protein [Ignavibacteriales bacterium]
MNFVEALGYVSSVLVAVSLTMSSIKKLRVANLIGAVLFSTYGLIIKAYPVFLVNFFIVITNIYYLSKMRKEKSLFEYKELTSANDDYLIKFLAQYKDDINKFFQGFNLADIKAPKVVFTLRNLVFAGLFIWEEVDKETISIKLDYVIPAYRDSKNARFLFSEYGGTLRSKGYKYFITETDSKRHISYLERLGFKQINNSNTYKRAI